MLFIDYLLPDGAIDVLTEVGQNMVFIVAIVVIGMARSGSLFSRPMLVSGTLDRPRGTINRSIEILMRPDLQGDAKEQERRALLRKELYPRFDFEESSRRALGSDWKDRTSDEQREFIEVFKELLVDSYASKIERYKGGKLVFDQERMILPYAELRTKIVTTKGEQCNVKFRVSEHAGDWRIYDIVIEGVSLVGNYRSQFADMLSKYSFSEMMERLKKTEKAAAAGGG